MRADFCKVIHDARGWNEEPAKTIIRGFCDNHPRCEYCPMGNSKIHQTKIHLDKVMELVPFGD